MSGDMREDIEKAFQVHETPEPAGGGAPVVAATRTGQRERTHHDSQARQGSTHLAIPSRSASDKPWCGSASAPADGAAAPLAPSRTGPIRGASPLAMGGETPTRFSDETVRRQRWRHGQIAKIAARRPAHPSREVAANREDRA